MKKIVTLLAMLGLSLSVTTNAFAAETDLTLSLERTSKGEVSVEVNTNGDVNGSVVEIEFDDTALSCEEEDIEVNAEYKAINIEDGVVKISFLSEENIPEGAVIAINFAVAEAAQSKHVSEFGIEGLTISSVDEDGTAGNEEEVSITETTDTIVQKPAPGEGGEGGEGGTGGDLDTGDDTVILPYVALAAVAVVGAGALYFRKK